MASVTFKANSGQEYKSEIVLPKANNNNMYKVVYHSVNTATLLAKPKTKESEQDPVTKWVSYGLSIKAKVLSREDGLYKFHIEYMGEPTLAFIDGMENQSVIIDSPDDITYEVKLALKPDSPVCSQISTANNNDFISGSKFCVSLP